MPTSSDELVRRAGRLAAHREASRLALARAPVVGKPFEGDPEVLRSLDGIELNREHDQMLHIAEDRLLVYLQLFYYGEHRGLVSRSWNLAEVGSRPCRRSCDPRRVRTT